MRDGVGRTLPDFAPVGEIDARHAGLRGKGNGRSVLRERDAFCLFPKKLLGELHDRLSFRRIVREGREERAFNEFIPVDSGCGLEGIGGAVP